VDNASVLHAPDDERIQNRAQRREYVDDTYIFTGVSEIPQRPVSEEFSTSHPILFIHHVSYRKFQTTIWITKERFVEIGKSYFDKFDEEAIKNNFVLVYEILDGMTFHVLLIEADRLRPEA